MAILTYFEAGALQKELEARFQIHLHMHDTCGGQYFGFDEDPGEAVRTYLKEYFAHFEKGPMSLIWSKDQLNFTLAD